MIVKLNQQGHSFKGLVAYLIHDKDAQSQERVAWHETGNMLTQDLEKAARVMAWTDCHADDLKRDAAISQCGRKATTGGVFHYSLSWAHGETPDADHQREQALATIETLGLAEHEYFMVAHDDTDHAHVHVVANLTHPHTGKRAEMKFTKNSVQAWALDYEQQHGMHCDARFEHAQQREAGQCTKHQDQKQDYSPAVTQAYHAADNGTAFMHALEEHGLTLAAARRGKGFVLVDGNGDIQKLTRQLDLDVKGKAKTAEINGKLADIDRDALPDPDRLAKERKEPPETPPEVIEPPLTVEPAIEPETFCEPITKPDGNVTPKAVIPEGFEPIYREHMRRVTHYEAQLTLYRESMTKQYEQPTVTFDIKGNAAFANIDPEATSNHFGVVKRNDTHFKQWVSDTLREGYDYLRDWVTSTINPITRGRDYDR